MGAYEQIKAQVDADLLTRRRAAIDAQSQQAPIAAPVVPDAGLTYTPEPSSLLRRAVVDPLVGLARGAAVGIPETVVGLADIPTLGHAGKALEDVSGHTFNEGRQYFNEMLSPETQAAQQKVAQAKGFTNTLVTALQNPSAVIQSATDSIPSAVAGGWAMRGVRALTAAKALTSATRAGLVGEAAAARAASRTLPAWAAAGAEEGLVTAGQNVEQVRQETPGGVLTPEQVALNVAGAAVTAGIGGGTGKLANKLGFETFDTAMVGGGAARTGARSRKDILKAVSGGALTEGALQELPQSAQEQIFQNISLGKPWDEGVGNAAAMGAVTGAAMGGGVNVQTAAVDAVHGRLADAANKIATRRAARGASASPTPLATELAASIPAIDVPGVTPELAAGPAAEPILDAENFTSENASDYAARQQAAAFDRTNPAIPEVAAAPILDAENLAAPDLLARRAAAAPDPAQDATVAPAIPEPAPAAAPVPDPLQATTVPAPEPPAHHAGGSVPSGGSDATTTQTPPAAVAPTTHGNFSVHHDSMDNTFSVRDDRTGSFVEHGLTNQAAAQGRAQVNQDHVDTTRQGYEARLAVDPDLWTRAMVSVAQHSNTATENQHAAIQEFDRLQAEQVAQAAAPDPTQARVAELTQRLDQAVATPDNQQQLLADHAEYTNLTGQLHPAIDAHGQDFTAQAAAPPTQQATVPPRTEVEDYSRWTTDNYAAGDGLFGQAHDEVIAAMETEGTDFAGSIADLPPGVLSEMMERTNRRYTQLQNEVIAAAPATQTAPADRYTTMHRNELLVARDEHPVDDWNAAIVAANPQRVEVTDDMMREALRALDTQGGGTNGQVQGGNQAQVTPEMAYQRVVDAINAYTDLSTWGDLEIQQAYDYFANQMISSRDPRAVAYESTRQEMISEGLDPTLASNRMELERRTLERYILSTVVSGTNTVVAPSGWTTLDTDLTPDEAALRQAIIDRGEQDAYLALLEDVRDEGLNTLGVTPPVSALVRETLRRYTAQQNTGYTTNPDLPQGPTEPVDQYSSMTMDELLGAAQERNNADGALYSRAFIEAWDALRPDDIPGEGMRQALRHFDFLQANPTAVTANALLPAWADANTPLAQGENDDAMTLVMGTAEPEYRALRTEIEAELTAAGIDANAYAPAVTRETMTRYVQQGLTTVPNSSYVIQRQLSGLYTIFDGTVTVASDVPSLADAQSIVSAHSAPISSAPAQQTASQQSPAEAVAPVDADQAVREGSMYALPLEFMHWLYGDQVRAPHVTDAALEGDMYFGPLSERVSRARAWPASPSRDRVVGVLSELERRGYNNLDEVRQGIVPIAPPVVTPYVPPAYVPTPASHTPEVVAAVTAPMTAVEERAMEKLRALANKLRRALADQPNEVHSTARTAWGRAFETVFRSVASKVDTFRYGDVPRSVDTIQGVVTTLNDYQRSIGSDLEVSVVDRRTGQPAVDIMDGSVIVKVRRGSGEWYTALTTDFNGRGTNATTDQDGSNPTRPQRQPQDGGYGYYVQHVINRNVPGASTSSRGMYADNQVRRLEHALSFMSRYDGPYNVDISPDTNLTHEPEYRATGGESDLGAMALRTYWLALQYYPKLARFSFDFATGEVKDGNGDVMPISAIVGNARLSGQRHHEPQQHIGIGGYSYNDLTVPSAFSAPQMLRALITQEVLRTNIKKSKVAATATTAEIPSMVMPKPEKLAKITAAIARNPGFTDIIFYNRTEGVKPKSDLQAPKLQQSLNEITQALQGKIPIQVVQTMAHLPGWHGGMPSFNAAYHNGAIYVVADQVSSVAEAKALILDHELRHAGLRQVLGKGLDTFLKQAWYAKTDEIKGFANSKGIETRTVNGRLEAAEEFIVSLAKEAKQHPLLDRAIAKIRSLIRALGFDIHLSRAELRAMVSRARVLDRTVTPEGETRFSRTVEEVMPTRIDEAMDAVGGKLDKLKAAFGRTANWLTQAIMPIDRLIDYAVTRPGYAMLKAALPKYMQLAHEMQSIQTQILGDASKRYDKYMAACDTAEKRANFNSILRDGTLWGIFPKGDKITWTTEAWKSQMMDTGKTDKTLSQAFADLNGRYKRLTDAERTQYHAAIDDMTKLRQRYQHSMMEFTKRITEETTAKNATSWLNAEGASFTIHKMSNGDHQVRSATGGVVRVERSAAAAQAGMTPQGKREQRLAQVAAKFNSVKGPYAPLSRFGDIVVEVYEKAAEPNAQGEYDEDRTARYHFENEAAAQEFLKKVAEDPTLRGTIDKRAERPYMRAQIPPEFVTEIDAAVERLGLDAQMASTLKEDFGRIWLSLTPESSALKHTMNRSGLAGFSEDMMRSYMSYSQRHARGIAYLDRGIPLRENIKGMYESIEKAKQRGENPIEARKLVEHLENHDKIVRGEKISGVTQGLLRLPFLFYLSSPSVFVVQSVQPFVMTLPQLATKFGYGKAFSAISKAYAAQANLKNPAYSNEQLDAWHKTAEMITNRQLEGMPIDDLIKGLDFKEQLLLGMSLATKRGAIDIALTHEFTNVLTGKVKGFGDKLTDKAGFLMRASEIMSRKAVFAATFELEMERHGNFEKAVENSIKTIVDTLYSYDKANRPNFMLGNVGRLMFQFQMYRVHTLSKLFQLALDSATGTDKRAAQKELALMMGNTMLLAGVTGVPFLATTMAAMGYLFGSSDEPWDFDQYMRSLVGDGVVGDALLKGAPALFGADLSRRVGMDAITDLFSGSPAPGASSTQRYQYYAGKMLGPIGGVTSDLLFKAPDLAAQGRWEDLILQTTPKPIKDLAKTFKVATDEGIYTGAGTLLVDSKDMNIWDTVLMAVGVNPSVLSNAQEKNYTKQRLSATITARRGELQKEFQRAVISQDPDKITAATEAVAAFGKKMPEFAISKQSLAAGVKQALRKELGIEDTNAKLVAAHYGIKE